MTVLLGMAALCDTKSTRRKVRGSRKLSEPPACEGARAPQKSQRVAV